MKIFIMTHVGDLKEVALCAFMWSEDKIVDLTYIQKLYWLTHLKSPPLKVTNNGLLIHLKAKCVRLSSSPNASGC